MFLAIWNSIPLWLVNIFIRGRTLSDFFFLQYWWLNSGPCTCKAVTLSLELLCQPFLPWLFFKTGSCFIPRPAYSAIFLISGSQEARTAGLSHCALLVIFCCGTKQWVSLQCFHTWIQCTLILCIYIPCSLRVIKMCTMNS
jgi:hypothetical protein